MYVSSIRSRNCIGNVLTRMLKHLAFARFSLDKIADVCLWPCAESLRSFGVCASLKSPKI